jgi:DNA-binding beta-propeller fold protein YncE
VVVAAVVFVAAGAGANPTPAMASVAARPAERAGARYVDAGEIALPDGVFTQFDISWVDPASSTLLVADRAHQLVQVIDTRHDKPRGAISGFAGPNGVAAKGRDAWVGDADSTLKVVDLASKSVAASIPTGGSGRADELAYDPTGRLILVANDRDTPPFDTVVSAPRHQSLARIPITGATGLEQPVWDPHLARFLQAVPTTVTNPGGEIAVIDPKTATIDATFPLDHCNPSGLTLGTARHLLVACGDSARVLDDRHGTVLATIPQGGGGDEVAADPTTNTFFVAEAGGHLAIINGHSNQLAQLLPTMPLAHSVAVDPHNHHVYVPEPNKGIEVFARR